MKKTMVFLIILSVLVAVASCGIQTNDSSSLENLEESHQNLTATELPHTSNWFQSDLSKVGLKNITIGETAAGHFIANNLTTLRHAYLLCDFARYRENSVYHDLYLAVETDSKILFKDLSSNNYSGSYGDALYVRDVDGDGIDEIIVQQTVGMTGGAGQYLSRIFKVIDDEIQEIFNSSTANLYDTGFSCILKDGFNLEVQNRFTEYSKTLYFGDNA